jgi:hypothetical protein
MVCMSTRIQVVVDPRERDAFRDRARAEGRSLSEWLREAGRQRLRESVPARLTNLDTLDAFFAECDAAEEGLGHEPDWAEHLTLIEESSREGLPRP